MDERNTLVKQLVEAALAELHHDRDENHPSTAYERKNLTQAFKKLLQRFTLKAKGKKP